MAGKTDRKQEEHGAPVAEPAAAWWQSIVREPLALGLIPLIVLRPWLDGVTYPSDNFYFVWGITILFVLMGVRALMRGESLRHPMPTLLLTLFWLLSGLTMFTGIQFYATYRTFLFWSGHFFLFLLVLNGIRSRSAIAIVLAACGVTFFAESLWGLVHFKYILPHVRESILQDPQLLKKYFQTTTPSPELVHRLQVNRAFGSLLFPNALAAFLILGIPFAFTAMLTSFRAFPAVRRVPATGAGPVGFLLTGGLTLLFSFGILYSLVWFVGTFAWPLPRDMVQIGGLPLVSSGGGTRLHAPGYVAAFCFLAVLLPLVFGIGAGYIAAKRGMGAVGLAIRMAMLPILFVMQVVVLWLTYSRGGLMALAAAIVAVAILLYLPRTRRTDAGAVIVKTAGVLLLVCALAADSGIAQDTAPGAVLAQPPAEPAPAGQAAPVSPLAGSGITREGVDLTLRDLANPASFWLRLTYWQTGLRMAWDNLLLGVGLGNFGTAYPIYQLPHAGDVKAAHNDYLQALCETGIFGMLLFCAFWAYFVVWGARRLLRAPRPDERLMLTGLYTGVLAFLIHSALDFNFFNPSLAFYAMLMAGVVYSRGGIFEPVPVASGKWRFALVPLLAAASCVAAMTFCVYRVDYYIGNRSIVNVGNHQLLATLFEAGDFFCTKPDGKPAYISIRTAGQLIPDRTVLESMGSLHVPAPELPRKYRALRPNEPIPQNAFLIVRDRAKAAELARPYIERWLENLEIIDSAFPYSPELAGYFVQYYENLAVNCPDPKTKNRYVMKMLDWAREGIKRSPMQADFHDWYGRALWLRGNLETGPSRREYFEKALQEYKVAAELYPILPAGWRKYGDALAKYGQALVSAGNKAGESYLEESARALERARQLETAQAG